MQLIILDHAGEGLFLDGSGAELDALENGSIEDVHASINTVANVLNWLFDESVDSRGVIGLVDDDTIF